MVDSRPRPAGGPAEARVAVPALAQPVRVSGQLVGLFSFDIGYEIDLEIALFSLGWGH